MSEAVTRPPSEPDMSVNAILARRATPSWSARVVDEPAIEATTCVPCPCSSESLSVPSVSFTTLRYMANLVVPDKKQFLLSAPVSPAPTI